MSSIVTSANSAPLKSQSLENNFHKNSDVFLASLKQVNNSSEPSKAVKKVDQGLKVTKQRLTQTKKIIPTIENAAQTCTYTVDPYFNMTPGANAYAPEYRGALAGESRALATLTGYGHLRLYVQNREEYAEQGGIKNSGVRSFIKKAAYLEDVYEKDPFWRRTDPYGGFSADCDGVQAIYVGPKIPEEPKHKYCLMFIGWPCITR